MLRRKLESDADRYCDRDRCHSGGFYLGLCRLRCLLSPPAPYDFAADRPFFDAATKIGIGRRTLLRRGQAPLRRLLLRIMPPTWRPVSACTARLCFRRAVLRCRNSRCRRNRSTLRQRPYAGGTAILCADENWNRTRHRCGNGRCRRAILLAGTIALH